MAQRPVTLADIVRGHVSLEIEGFDRLYFNGWVPALIGEAREFQWVFDATRKASPNRAPWFKFYRTERLVTCYYF